MYVECEAHGMAYYNVEGALLKVWDERGKVTTAAKLEGCHIMTPREHEGSGSTCRILSEEEAVLWLLAR